jgi:hypothetical protein
MAYYDMRCKTMCNSSLLPAKCCSCWFEYHCKSLNAIRVACRMITQKDPSTTQAFLLLCLWSSCLCLCLMGVLPHSLRGEVFVFDMILSSGEPTCTSGHKLHCPVHIHISNFSLSNRRQKQKANYVLYLPSGIRYEPCIL